MFIKEIVIEVCGWLGVRDQIVFGATCREYHRAIKGNLRIMDFYI